MEKLNIIDELNKLGISTTRKGAKTFCCCPLHKEDSPSCLIDIKNNRFHCFGCGEDGDVYELVSKVTGKPIDILKGKKIVLSDEIASNNFALKFYQKCLNETTSGEKAIDYLVKRGLDKDTIDYFSIGLAPDKESSMFAMLQKASDIKDLGISKNACYNSSLTKKDKSDFFRNRIMFPICDLNGNVIGFTGRTIDGDEIKYLNTPETLEFKKKEILFNFYKALGAIKKQKKVFIVEGPFDVISYHLAGIENVISPLTCNISSEQLKLITDNCGKDLEFIIAFDSDKAGINGIKNCQELFKSESIWNYKMIRYAYKDAGEYVEKGHLEDLKKVISNPFDIADYMASFYHQAKGQDAKSRTINTFVSLIYTLPEIFLKEEVSKFEDLINDKEGFVSDLLFKRKGENNLLKLIMASIKKDKKNLKTFNFLVNEKLLTKGEKEVLNNLEHYDFKKFENNYKFTNLVIAFLKKRVKKFVNEEEIF